VNPDLREKKVTMVSSVLWENLDFPVRKVNVVHMETMALKERRVTLVLLVIRVLLVLKVIMVAQVPLVLKELKVLWVQLVRKVNLVHLDLLVPLVHKAILFQRRLVHLKRAQTENGAKLTLTQHTWITMPTLIRNTWDWMLTEWIIIQAVLNSEKFLLLWRA
jgi:hypothetical protein